ncbi:MAG: hypothetical protein RLY43_47, partial [Bacteroidota bacterium]
MDREKIEILIAKKNSIREIAIELNTTVAKVRYFLFKYGLK